ncbi:MAG: hypothetical protein IJK83_09555 [Clostridiales bacterium]|nr:hypothetical protein [Clostridiales bacterium]
MRSSLKKSVSVLLVVICIFTLGAEVLAGSKRTLKVPNQGTNYVTIKGDNSSDLLSDTYEVWIYGTGNSVTISKSKNCTVSKKYFSSTGAYRITIKVKGLTFGKVLVKINSGSTDTEVVTYDNEVTLYRGNCY